MRHAVYWMLPAKKWLSRWALGWVVVRNGYVVYGGNKKACLKFVGNEQVFIWPRGLRWRRRFKRKDRP
jgi:hypothetical protein